MESQHSDRRSHEDQESSQHRRSRHEEPPVPEGTLIQDVRDAAPATPPRAVQAGSAKVKKEKKDGKKKEKKAKQSKKRTATASGHRQQEEHQKGDSRSPTPEQQGRSPSPAQMESEDSLESWAKKTGFKRRPRSPQSSRPRRYRNESPPPRRERGEDRSWKRAKPWEAQKHWQSIKCEFCGHILKGTGSAIGNANALKSHMMTSSKCLAAQGRDDATEPCQWCGQPLAAKDWWAKEQHSWHCKGWWRGRWKWCWDD